MTDFEYIRLYSLVVNIECEFNRIVEGDLEEIYKFLNDDYKNKSGLLPIEYKFMCWLNENDPLKYPIEINKPFLPEITSISLVEFETTFCFNHHRTRLFNKLRSKLTEIALNNGVNNFNILIGGSITNVDNASPRDVDFIVLLPAVLINNSMDVKIEDDQSIIDDKELDVFCIPENYNFKSLKAYVALTMLGNIPEFSDKEYEFKRVVNNIFKSRNIYKLSVTII
jgi:hypothetical protein